MAQKIVINKDIALSSTVLERFKFGFSCLTVVKLVVVTGAEIDSYH